MSFGSQVLDNEEKQVNTGKSGIPNDCPGKFPSPWTPGTHLNLEAQSDRRPRTKLTEALLDARTTAQPKPGQKPKARDDSDITIDLGAPRSESGKYWKEQNEKYAERSEKEMKKVIAKQQLAKKFAMKKDGEVTELATKLEHERKQFRIRERDLEQQNREYQERLHTAMSENSSASIEVAALKARVATLEKSIAMPSSELQASKTSFNIYEDLGKDLIRTQEKEPEVSSLSMVSSGKENASPTPRRHRRQTLPTSQSRPHPVLRLGAEEGETSILLGKRTLVIASTTQFDLERSRNIPFAARPLDTSSANPAPHSPINALPSSPLPMPSPDPWLGIDGSSIQEMDKMALPVSAGVPYSRPEWNPPLKQQRAPKASSHLRSLPAPRSTRRTDEAIVDNSTPPMVNKQHSKGHDDAVAHSHTKSVSPRENDRSKDDSPDALAIQKTSSNIPPATSDPKFDVSKITAHHAEGSTQVKRDRAEIVPSDRKDQARKRLEERKRLRKNAPV